MLLEKTASTIAATVNGKLASVHTSYPVYASMLNAICNAPINGQEYVLGEAIRGSEIFAESAVATDYCVIRTAVYHIKGTDGFFVFQKREDDENDYNLFQDEKNFENFSKKYSLKGEQEDTMRVLLDTARKQTILLILTYLYCNGETVESKLFRKAKDSFRAVSIEGAKKDIEKSVLTLGEMLKSALDDADNDEVESIFPKGTKDKAENCTAISSSFLFDTSKPEEIIRDFGTPGAKFHVFQMERCGDKYHIDPDRKLTEEEKMLMYEIPEYIELSENVLYCAKEVHDSWQSDRHLRTVNLLFEGPNGTGKTVDAKCLSSLLGIPYTKITCFSDMAMNDVLGAILPVAKEDKGEGKGALGFTVDDVRWMPDEVYYRATGKRKRNATPDEALNALGKAMADSDSPEYVYYASEIAKALENGWLCEIQEPTCVRDAAVLMALNSAMEPDGSLNLPQRTVKRHPDSIIVMTTNPAYEGCRPLNQSLRDRFQTVNKCELPNETETVARLMASTGCRDREFVTVTVKTMQGLNKELEENGIVAHISLRGMEQFLAKMMRGGELKKSLYTSIIYKITTDEEDLAVIETYLENASPIYTVTYKG